MTLPRRVACKSSRDDVGAFTLREHNGNRSCNNNTTSSNSSHHSISTINSNNDHNVKSNITCASHRIGKLRRLEVETYANMEEQLIHYLDELYQATKHTFTHEMKNVNENTCSNGVNNKSHIEPNAPMQWAQQFSSNVVNSEVEHMKWVIQSFHNFISSVYSALIETSFVLRSCWVHMGNVHEAFWPLAHLSCITQHILLTLAHHTVSSTSSNNNGDNIITHSNHVSVSQGEYLILQKGPEHLPWVGVTLCIIENLICALRHYAEHINNIHDIDNNDSTHGNSGMNSCEKQYYYYYSHFSFHELCHWAHSSSSSNESEPINHPISRLLFLNCNGFGWLDGEEHNDTNGYHESVQCRQAINYALNQLIHHPAYHTIGHAQHFTRHVNQTNKPEESHYSGAKTNKSNSLMRSNLHFSEEEGCTMILMSNAILLDGGVPSLSIAQDHLLFTTFHQYGRGLACCVISRKTALAMQKKEKKAAKLHHHQHSHKSRERHGCVSISHPLHSSITPEGHSSVRSNNINSFNNSSHHINNNTDPGDAVSDAGSLSTTCSSSYVDSNSMDGKLSSLESSLTSSQGSKRPVLLTRTRPSPLSLSLSLGHSYTTDQNTNNNDTEHSSLNHHDHLLLEPSHELQHNTVKTNTVAESNQNIINTIKNNLNNINECNFLKENNSNSNCLQENVQVVEEKAHEPQQQMKEENKNDKVKYEKLEFALANPLTSYKLPPLEAISCGSKTVNGVAIQAMMPHPHGPLIIHVEVDSLQHLKKSECRTFNTVKENRPMMQLWPSYNKKEERPHEHQENGFASNNQYNLSPSVKSLFVSHHNKMEKKNISNTKNDTNDERSYCDSITQDNNAKQQQLEEEEEEEQQQQYGVNNKKTFPCSNTTAFTSTPSCNSPSSSSAAALISAPWLKPSNTYEVFTSTSVNTSNTRVLEEWKELFEWLVVLLMAPVPTLIVEWTINTNVETCNTMNNIDSDNSVHNVISLSPTTNHQNEPIFYTSSFAHVQESHKTREVCDLRITSASSVIIQLLRSYGEHLYESLHQQQQAREQNEQEEEEEEQQQQQPFEEYIQTSRDNNNTTSEWTEKLNFCEQIRYITSQFLPLSHLNSINMSNNCYCANDNDNQRPRLWSKGGLDVVNESEQEVYDNMLLTSVQFRRSQT